MKSTSGITRRTAMSAIAATTGVALAAPSQAAENAKTKGATKGRLKQSVCKWCYKGVSVDELAREAAAMGLKGVELLGPDDWPAVKKHGLTCPMASGPGGIKDGWNDPKLHDALVEKSEALLPLVAGAGLPNMIVFSGNRRGLPDAEGLLNCAKGLKRITPLAEKLGVTICMELLNSKVNHKDYQCDHTAWGVDLAKRIGSPRFKLLYDIYHMQIMEGDVISTIEENIDYIGHFHTGGVPGRKEIDEGQELFYPRICQAIVNTGYTGYIGQEFIPERDPITSLREAATLCDV